MHNSRRRTRSVFEKKFAARRKCDVALVSQLRGMTSGELMGPSLGLTWAVLEGFWANARQSLDVASIELRKDSVAFLFGER